MKRSGITRVIALLLWLLHGGVYGAGAILDAQVAARANDAVAHVEEAGTSGAGCVSHDEATCQLCRIGSITGCSTPEHFAVVLVAGDGQPIASGEPSHPAHQRTALHSRAPPVA